jgi:hypothetical protein
MVITSFPFDLILVETIDETILGLPLKASEFAADVLGGMNVLREEGFSECLLFMHSELVDRVEDGAGATERAVIIL